MKLRRAVIVILFIVLTIILSTTMVSEGAATWKFGKQTERWHASSILPVKNIGMKLPTWREVYNVQPMPVVVITSPTTTNPPITTTTSVTSSTEVPMTVASTLPSPALVVPTDNNDIWACIIAHESGGNPTIVNSSSGAGGLYQFLQSSWIAYGGSKYANSAQYATPEQQTEIAYYAQSISGWWPWKGDGCTPVG